MNFRKLITYLTMGTAAAMPLAVAQNPTILQGNYITNVFGNSNFVLNPNAQTNVANVTTSSATVTRSTTTPLVATSEFNITTSTSTGYADWSLRSFDQGMKNNNCEARFTYRGFSVGSTTAQILQGANVVAQLTLTASTDPRIASINFPCGDLSAATKFRLQQATASLTGTNEIGVIYVGLATNMANVAQAEMVGAVQWQGCATPEPARTGSTAFGNFSSGGSCSGKTLFGKATSANEADASITFNNLPAGYYFLQTNTFAYIAAPTNASIVGQVEVYEDTSGAMSGRTYIQSQVANTLVHTPTPSGWYYFATTANRTFRLRGSISNAANTLQVSLGFSGGSQATQFALYRFPSSSELVVTPERQNVFGAVQWPSNTNYTFATTSTTAVDATNVAFASASGTYFGGAKASATANVYGMKMENIPVGVYRISVKISTHNQSGSNDCTSELHDNSGLIGSSQSSIQNNSWNNGGKDIVAIYRVTSFQALQDFKVKLRSGNVATTCSINASNGGTQNPSIVFEPLDQPSNSALYVQGPVLGAQTGAAIPSGYVGELKRTFTALTNISRSVYQDLQSLVLTPGVWMCSTQTRIARNGATVTSPFDFLGCIGGTSGASGCTISYLDSVIGTGKNSGISPTFDWLTTGTPSTQIRYTGSNLIFADGTTVASATGTIYHKVYLDSTAGTPQASGSLECTRLN